MLRRKGKLSSSCCNIMHFFAFQCWHRCEVARWGACGGLGVVDAVSYGGCCCILSVYLLSFDHASTGPRGYWSFLLLRLWVVVRLDGAASYFGLLGSSGLRSLPWDRGFGTCVGCCGRLLYAVRLYYLFD